MSEDEAYVKREIKNRKMKGAVYVLECALRMCIGMLFVLGLDYFFGTATSLIISGTLLIIAALILYKYAGKQ